MKENIEKRTGLWLGLFILVMSIVYIFVTLGKTTWINWIAVIWGFFLGGLLILEAGVLTYFQKKDWKKLSFGDIIVWLSVAFAVVIIINTILIFGTLRESAPVWLVNFSTITGLTAGIGGAILGILHMTMSRFK